MLTQNFVIGLSIFFGVVTVLCLFRIARTTVKADGKETKTWSNELRGDNAAILFLLISAWALWIERIAQ